MKIIFKRALFYTIWLLLPFCLIAQKGALGVELNGGLTFYQGDVSKEGFGTFKGKESLLSCKVNYGISDYWSAEMTYYRGKISASDTFYLEDNYRAQRQFDFQTFIQAIDLKARFLPLGQLRFQPHVSTGIGIVFFEPTASLLENTHPELTGLVKDDLDRSLPPSAWYIPIEFGCSYQLFDRISMSSGLLLNFTSTDFLDGVSSAGNPNDNDRFGQFYLGLKFRFNGIKDIDGDGIPDEEDECPFKPGTRGTHGCPDYDEDGIRDSQDRCPYAAGEYGMDGCPDTDRDGTADPYDRCPTKAGPPEALGCPRTDSDHDGIEDHLDECPLVKGPIERNGCPAIDTDLDGILDEDDQCPLLFGLPVFKGCPDSDGDGIVDDQDACPSHFGLFEEKGCPAFTNAQEEAFVLTKQKLHFGGNNSSITNFNLLDRIVAFLEQNPGYQLKVNGFADPLGSDETTDYVSQLRAEKVRQYIQSLGVSSNRLEARGLGVEPAISLKPGLTNQSKNRRVEFLLYLP